MNPTEKFLKGEDLTKDEFHNINLVDKCRYCVDKYFKETGFNVIMVADKINELLGQNLAMVPDVRDSLYEFYGEPGQ